MSLYQLILGGESTKAIRTDDGEEMGVFYFEHAYLSTINTIKYYSLECDYAELYKYTHKKSAARLFKKDCDLVALRRFIISIDRHGPKMKQWNEETKEIPAVLSIWVYITRLMDIAEDQDVKLEDMWSWISVGREVGWKKDAKRIKGAILMPEGEVPLGKKIDKAKSKTEGWKILNICTLDDRFYNIDIDHLIFVFE
jgi:hypothetical protein